MSLDYFLPLRMPFVKKKIISHVNFSKTSAKRGRMFTTDTLITRACFPMCPASFACHTGIEHMRTVAQILRARASAGADPGEVKWAEFSPPFF